LLGFIIVTSIPILISAQEYIPFPEEDAYWTVSEFNYQISDYDTYIYTILGDTAINSKHYKKIYQLSDIPDSNDTLWVLHNLMRQDTINKKVYFIRVYQSETNEKLGYDFDVELGDTVNLPAFDYSNSGDSIYKVMQPVFDSTLLWNGEYRRNYSFRSIDPYSGFSLFAIEGVGTHRSPFPNLFYYDEFHQSETVCHIVNGVYLFGASPYPDECDFSVRLEEIDFTFDLVIYPQPACNSVTFKIHSHDCLTDLILFNRMGSTVHSKKFQKCIRKYTLDTRDLPEGIYFAVIHSNDKVFKRSLIINH
jgi:hypothetical protein